jgi:hypothetical protein
MEFDDCRAKSMWTTHHFSTGIMITLDGGIGIFGANQALRPWLADNWSSFNSRLKLYGRVAG